MDFKGRAQKWDNETMIKRSEVIAKKINEIVGNKKDCSIMEYGCATGLIGFDLCDNFRKVTLIDAEEEMINVVKEKIDTYKTTNVFPKKLDLTKETYSGEKFDIIYTSMTLHHIIDTKNIVKILYNLLNENGVFCVVELDKEDGSFHINEKNFDGHNGFEHETMENAFKNAGFSNIKSETFFNGEKKNQKKIIPYSLFYTIGEKQEK